MRPEPEPGRSPEEGDEEQQRRPEGNGPAQAESRPDGKEGTDGVPAEEPGMALAPAEQDAVETPEPPAEVMQPDTGHDEEGLEAVPAEDPEERSIPIEQDVPGAVEQEVFGAPEQEPEQAVFGEPGQGDLGLSLDSPRFSSEEDKSNEDFPDEVGAESLPFSQSNLEQLVIGSGSQSHTSSLASPQWSASSVGLDVHVESVLDTGVATPSPYREADFQQFHPQIGERGTSRQEEREEEVHAADGEARTEGSEEVEEETQLIVLDPEHPLMKRFQAALKNYLTKQMAKVNLDLQELKEATKKGRVQREELGVVLYGVQQQLARLQMELEKNHNRHSQIAMVRRQLEDELQDLRTMYKKTCQSTQDERRRVSALQTEVENLALNLFYMQNTGQDVRDDISVMKRAVKKAEVEQMQAEVEKKKQDLHVDRLTRKVDELREQIALYEAQCIAQAEDTRLTRQAVSEACMEIQAIHLEKKQLMQQWNSSLTGMKRRDEAYTAMQEALRQSRHQLTSMEMEIEVYKKSITKEEERNELLATILNRSENDANMSRKLIAQCLAKQDALQVEFGTYTRALHETEQALGRASLDQATRLNELGVVKKEIEKETEHKQEVENEIMAKLQDQLMSSKAAKYFSQLAAKLQMRKMDLEMHFSKVDNDTAQVALDITHTNCRLSTLQKTLSELEKETKTINDLVSHSEIEIAKRNQLIERKQGVINLYNKKMETMISQLGGQELGPLEIEINSLTKQIEEYNSEVMTLQKYWLRLQKELVKLTQEQEEQLVSLDMLKKEITIRQQKKVRIENEIQQEKNEQKDIERHMRNMSNDMIKLNMLISKNSNSSQELQYGNTITENEFVRSLKAAEKESIEMQEKLDRLSEEKERLLNSLVEAEHQIMLWEKKIQLAKEMRATVDSETGQGEIRAMRAEIHRMQVRYSQLTKQQEKMIRDMEAAVSRRETITTQGEGQSKVDKKQITKSDFHYKKQELRRKISETQKSAQDCNKTILELENTQASLSTALLERQQQVSSLQAESNALDADIEQLQDKKRWNLSEIVGYQTRQKHLQAAKEGKYISLCRSEHALQSEQRKQQSRLHSISIIVHQIQQEYPQCQRALRRVSQALESKLDSLEAKQAEGQNQI
ncbi:coiled-coil domain-containing protein 40 [Alligator mississippiensis]|uniref:Coiled-coil domain-containing protein 40 n=1 Tax=Alligator mississippiensis TaxID=8496 RepID=A0A151NKJ4_ALLMI|nr:coiled-coil domain-containing protein 40 [Alligator mississippiensis]